MQSSQHVEDLIRPSSDDGLALSVVIPCYNERDGLETLLKRVRAAATQSFGEAYEIILVDDGSVDDSWPYIEAAASKHAQTIGIKLSRNHGHQLALTCGLSYARGDYVFILDADLQDPPELLGEMVALLRQNQADVVYGKRISRKGETWLKKFSAAAFYKLLTKHAEVYFPTDAGDFRLITSRVAKALCAMPEPDRFVRGMVAWIGLKQIPFDYHRDARETGETKYSLRKMSALAVRAFMGFSMLPLKFAAQFALLMFATMICVFIYALISWWFFDTVSGWTSLVMLIAFVSGIQLLVLSVLGEYIGRTYLSSKGRPLFIVDRVAGAREGDPEIGGKWTPPGQGLWL